MNKYLKDNLILGDSLEIFFMLNYATTRVLGYKREGEGFVPKAVLITN